MKMSEVACSSSINSLKTIFANQFMDHNIEIFGTKEEPLFKANDIGKMLGIEQISTSIQNLDDLCKVLNPGNATGDFEEQWFLTEDGLIELLCLTKKPIAKDFRVWIRAVVKEIRKNGEYNLKRQLEQQGQRELELTNRLQRSNEEKERLAAELEAFKSKKYEEIDKTGCNYTLKTDSLDFYRNGMSKNKDCKNRVSAHQTSNEKEIEVLHEFKTSCPKLLESCIHYALEVYRCNSGREFFRCKPDHIINIVDIIGHVLDTCRSSYNNITRVELIRKVLEKVSPGSRLEGGRLDGLEVQTEDENLAFWVSENVVYEEGSCLVMSELYTRWFNNQIIGNKDKSKFRVKFEKCLEKFKTNNKNFVPTMKEGMYNPVIKTYKGWKDIRLINH